MPVSRDETINLKIAKALKLSVPPSLLGRAEEVTEFVQLGSVRKDGSASHRKVCRMTRVSLGN